MFGPSLFLCLSFFFPLLFFCLLLSNLYRVQSCVGGERVQAHGRLRDPARAPVILGAGPQGARVQHAEAVELGAPVDDARQPGLQVAHGPEVQGGERPGARRDDGRLPRRVCGHRLALTPRPFRDASRAITFHWWVLLEPSVSLFVLDSYFLCLPGRNY